MIDIRFLRENPDIVKQNIKNKFQDDKLPLVDEVIEFDAKSRRQSRMRMHFVLQESQSQKRLAHLWHRVRKKKQRQ